jgi:hypothetical protein
MLATRAKSLGEDCNQDDRQDHEQVGGVSLYLKSRKRTRIFGLQTPVRERDGNKDNMNASA